MATTGPDGKVRYVKRPMGAPGGPYGVEPGDGWDSEGRPVQEDHHKTHGQVGNSLSLFVWWCLPSGLS